MNFYQTPNPNTQYPTPNQIVGKSKNTESGKQKLESNPVHPVKSLWENRRFYLTGWNIQQAEFHPDEIKERFHRTGGSGKAESKKVKSRQAKYEVQDQRRKKLEND